jgi:hypothetical protein
MEDLQRLLDQEPFVPFRIILTNGHAYEVTSPCQAFIEGSWVGFYFAGSDRSAKRTRRASPSRSLPLWLMPDPGQHMTGLAPPVLMAKARQGLPVAIAHVSSPLAMKRRG